MGCKWKWPLVKREAILSFMNRKYNGYASHKCAFRQMVSDSRVRFRTSVAGQSFRTCDIITNFDLHCISHRKTKSKPRRHNRCVTDFSQTSKRSWTAIMNMNILRMREKWSQCFKELLVWLYATASASFDHPFSFLSAKLLRNTFPYGISFDH